MSIEYQLPNPSKAPEGRHVYRVGLIYDKSRETLFLAQQP